MAVVVALTGYTSPTDPPPATTGVPFTYHPADPLNVTDVTSVRVYAPDSDRTGQPLETIGVGDADTNGGYLFYATARADGVYPISTTLVTPAGTVVDSDDSITFPVVIPASPGDPVALWVTPATLAADSRLSALSDLQLTTACRIATNLLWRLSGRRFHGPRATSVKIMNAGCGCRYFPDGYDSYATFSGPGYTGPGGFLWACGCTSALLLPDTPVRAVTDVAVNGTLLASTAYRLDESYRLVRTDSDWPFTSDERTVDVRVSYVYGEDVPEDGLYAAQTYALQVALGMAGDGGCQLSDRVQSITRAGESIVLTDVNDAITAGRTGLTRVDAWLNSVNPRALTGQRNRVLSPDLPSVRH